MSDEDPTAFITMVHGETGGMARATRAALDEVWRDKGWELASEADSMRGMKKDQLIELATERGIEVDKRMTNAEILEKLKEA